MPGPPLYRVLLLLAFIGLETAAHAQINPTPDPILARARHLRSQHKPAEAAALLRPYTEQHPDDVPALMLLGNTLLNLQQTEEAGQTFARALAAEPNSIPANLAVGNLMLSQHSYPEAMDRFETILAQNWHQAPDHVAARKGEVAAATELAVSSRRDKHPD